METSLDQPNLRYLLADRIPEARREFMAIPGEASVNTTFNTFYEVTAELAHQYKFRAVKCCLLVAEELLQANDKKAQPCRLYRLYLSVSQAA